VDKTERIITDVKILRTRCAVNADYGLGLLADECEKAVRTLDDAIALLESQEPRLMTLEEAQMSQMIEYRSGNTRDVGAELYATSPEAYNKIWRVWTSRPTETQMEAEPWD